MTKKLLTGAAALILVFILMAPACERERLPDMVVGRISLTPVNPAAYDPIRIEAVIKNNGKTAAAASVAAMRVGGESNPRQFNIPALAPGHSHTIHRAETLDVAQTYKITVYADYTGAVTESDENNEKAFHFTVRGAAPLAFSGFGDESENENANGLVRRDIN
jgi:subtilase family serine protease